MLEQLLKYYKTKVTSYGLVFKNMKLIYNITIFFIGITSIYLLVIVFSALLNIVFQFVDVEYSFHLLGVLVGLIIITSVFLGILNRRAKKILKDKHSIIVREKQWRNSDFNKLQITKLVEYLTANKFDSSDKINQIINILNKEIERKRFPALIAPGIFLSLSLPVWIQFLGKIFEDVNDGSEAFILMITITFFIFILIGFISFAKWNIAQLIDVMIISEISLMKHLIEKLEETLLIEFVD